MMSFLDMPFSLYVFPQDTENLLGFFLFIMLLALMGACLIRYKHYTQIGLLCFGLACCWVVLVSDL